MSPETPSQVMQFIDRFGFPAFVALSLGAFGWVIGRGIMFELGRLTRAVTLVVLAMQFAPEFHEDAENLYEESLDAATKRKEDLSHERRRHRKPK